MGKSKYGDGDNSRKRQFRDGGGKEEREVEHLFQRPMAAALKNVRAGPECLECRGPIDSREGWSIPNVRGSRKSQRNGYLHPDCQEKAEQRTAKNQQEQGNTGRVRLEVPVYTDDELDQMTGKRGES